jgi:DNA-directed RNA polymerase subunit RPC12/RpoP
MNEPDEVNPRQSAPPAAAGAEAVAARPLTAASFARAFGERCPNCGAEVGRGGEVEDQSDGDGGRCQICGVRLRLVVSPERPRVGLWAASVIGLAMGSGFCWPLLSLLPPEMATQPPLVTPGVILITLLVLVIGNQTWFCQRRAGTQWSLAVLSFAASGVCPVLYAWVLLP